LTDDDRPRSQRAGNFGRSGHRQSLDLIEPKARVSCPLIELDPRHALDPKIFSQHFSLDGPDAFPMPLNMIGSGLNTCELLHTDGNFLSAAGS
jgi:hypothetical protein